MSAKIKNAKQKPQIFYGLHMSEGLAEYRSPGTEPYRILIGADTIKNMNPTFAGCPVFVNHVDEVNLENIEKEADGWVIESFFNKADGKHWVKFVVVTDDAHLAIQKGYRLSNCYIPTAKTSGGLHHGVDYTEEITNGEFEHLAIVKNPRYDESVIMTPAEFKEYNGKKEQELYRLANSQEKETMLDFFKREKLANANDLAKSSVTLPKSKKEGTVESLLNEMDEMVVKSSASDQMANGDHYVNLGDEKMTVNDLIEKYKGLCGSRQNAEEDEAKKKKEAEEKKANEDKAAAEKKASDEKKANALAADEKKKADEAAAKAKEEGDKHFNALKNAGNNPASPDDTGNVETIRDMVARGKERYGSKTA